jgi:hypothetical protein
MDRRRVPRRREDFIIRADELLTAFLELESTPLDLQAVPLYVGLHYDQG